MNAKAVILCASAFLLKSISGQCIGSPINPGYIGNPSATPALAAEAALGYAAAFTPGPGCGPAVSGGGFQVTSKSPLSPTGITVQTDSMVIEGPLAVAGQLPFLGVVALEGPLPITGQGLVSYGCGNGNVGIVNEVGPGFGYPNTLAPEFGPGYGYGYNGNPNAIGRGPFY